MEVKLNQENNSKESIKKNDYKNNLYLENKKNVSKS